MLDYQSFICPKCGKAVLRTEGTKYCEYCGAKLPELKELPKVRCPMCHGTGKVSPHSIQPLNPASPYFSVMANAEREEHFAGVSKKIDQKDAK